MSGPISAPNTVVGKPSFSVVPSLFTYARTREKSHMLASMVDVESVSRMYVQVP